jgi:hypothetical protein
MERLAAHIGRRLAGDAESQQHLAVERAFTDRMVAVICQENRVVRRHVDAVGTLEDALPPRPQEISVAVEHDHRVFAAIEAVDIVVFVDPDRRDIGIEGPAIRQFGPVVNDLVTKAVRPEYYRHGGPLLSPKGLG